MGSIIRAAFGIFEVGTKQKMATQPVRSWGPTCGQTGYKTGDILVVLEVETQPKLVNTYIIDAEWASHM